MNDKDTCNTDKPGQYSIEQFMNTESLMSISITDDDGAILYGSDAAGVYLMHTGSLCGEKMNQNS